MNLLLDTMVVSELRRIGSGNVAPRFLAWTEAVALSQAYLSVITLHEMEVGCLLTARKDPIRSLVYREWLETVAEAFEGRIVEVSLPIARLAAGYHVPDPAPMADALIAATAAELDVTVATRNTRDFARFGVRLVNPWD